MFWQGSTFREISSYCAAYLIYIIDATSLCTIVDQGNEWMFWVMHGLLRESTFRLCVCGLWRLTTIVWKDGGIQYPWFYIDEHYQTQTYSGGRPEMTIF